MKTLSSLEVLKAIISQTTRRPCVADIALSLLEAMGAANVAAFLPCSNDKGNHLDELTFQYMRTPMWGERALWHGWAGSCRRITWLILYC